MNTSVADIRQNYAMGSFDEQDAHENPFEQFNIWWQAAVNSQIVEVNAITLATVDAENKPHARTVLLKGFDALGFDFYTNYHSNKGKQINSNPNAAIVIFWKELERQIRLEGTLEMLPTNQSDAYFNSRPFGSQIGAIASPQSTIIANRQWLIDNENEALKKYNQENISRPSHWGGYKLLPTSFEFWQGRPSRLHDRILYTYENEVWVKNRLAP
jgi:pyridoxamine 5'-phosphate oxidase